jgi:uncharacterized protein (DUF433 family)
MMARRTTLEQLNVELPTLVIHEDPVPLVAKGGVVRVRGTRVPLDTVVNAFEQGATPEEIALRFPSLKVADIYSVIGYYLRRREQIRAYLEQREVQAERVRQQNETRWNPVGIRERLLARQAAKEVSSEEPTSASE